MNIKFCNHIFVVQIVQEYLKLTVAAFEKLSHVFGRRYEKAISILEKFSKIKIFVIMLDLECDDLVMEMFQHFLRIIRLAPLQHKFFMLLWFM